LYLNLGSLVGWLGHRYPLYGYVKSGGHTHFYTILHDNKHLPIPHLYICLSNHQ